MYADFGAVAAALASTLGGAHAERVAPLPRPPPKLVAAVVAAGAPTKHGLACVDITASAASTPRRAPASPPSAARCAARSARRAVRAAADARRVAVGAREAAHQADARRASASGAPPPLASPTRAPAPAHRYHQPTTLADLTLAPSTADALIALLARARARAALGGGRIAGDAALLHGPPGVGKSAAAAVLAAELGRPLVTVDAATLTPGRRGAASLAVSAAVAASTGALLFVDAADALLADPVAASALLIAARRMPTGLTLVSATGPGAAAWAAAARVRSVAFRLPNADAGAALWRDALRLPGVCLGPGVIDGGGLAALAARRLAPARVAVAAAAAVDAAHARAGVLHAIVTMDDLEAALGAVPV
jgi:hypothetical protein